MKNLLRRKWLRRLFQWAVALGSLLVLAVLLINWWGARMKRDVIERMKADGHPVVITEILRPLPPDGENFGMIPILAEARDEWRRSGEYGKPAAPGTANAMLEALWPDDKLMAFQNVSKPEGRKQWKTKLGLSGTPAECLAQYDVRHNEVLAQLRSGLDRPHAVSPMLHRFVLTKQLSVLSVNSFRFSGTLTMLSKAMRFRVELALDAGQPDAAYESFLMLLRLCDSSYTEHLHWSQLSQNSLLDAMMPTLARALEGQIWSGEQIAVIRDKLAGINVVDRTLWDLDKDNILMFAVVDQMRSGDRRNLLDVTKKLRSKPMPAWANSFLSDVEHAMERLLPRGWFDANAARLVQSQLDLRDDLGSADGMVRWREVCETYEKRIKAQSDWNGWMTIPKRSGVWPSIAKDSPSWQVRLQLAVSACDLAIYRRVHGEFPGDLGELPVSTIDPWTGEPLRYRREGDGYVLYSVGYDLKDDGGKMGKGKNWGTPDFIWKWWQQ